MQVGMLAAAEVKWESMRACDVYYKEILMTAQRITTLSCSMV